MIVEPVIEDDAVRNNIPVELYYYAELGLNYFSVEDFQHRDPFSNPEQFEKLFARLQIKDWIVPASENGRYQIPEKARNAVRQLVHTGDELLIRFMSMTDIDLDRLSKFMKKIITANRIASEPPYKWAISNRFRTAESNDPEIIQIRETLLDIFAYRDDCYLSAARPYFNQAGIVWSVLDFVWNGSARTAEKIAEASPFRGYETGDYSAALQAAVEVGWVEHADSEDAYRPTQAGSEMREQAEKLTDEYFYRSWAGFSQDELDEFYELLLKFREQLHAFEKSLQMR
jgi:hypothetical protein